MSNEGGGRPIAKHAIILAHPEHASFNGAVADAYAAVVNECGQIAVLRDLYGIAFDPVLKPQERPGLPSFAPSPDVEMERGIIADCDVVVLIYPIWFGTPPAMLKGYVERVLGSGVTPRSVQERGAGGFLAGKRLVSFTSSAASDSWLSEQGELLALRTLFDRYLVHAFGMRGDQHFHFPRIVPGLRERFVNEHLARVRAETRRICGELLVEHYRPGCEQGSADVTSQMR